MRPPERAQDRVLEPLSPLPGQSSSPEITRFGISPPANVTRPTALGLAISQASELGQRNGADRSS